jgi:hypothetical protein
MPEVAECTTDANDALFSSSDECPHGFGRTEGQLAVRCTSGHYAVMWSCARAGEVKSQFSAMKRIVESSSA